MHDVWLPKGYELPNGLKIRSLLYVGMDWQIFDGDGSNNILITRPELVQKWDEFGFLDRVLFGQILFGVDSFQYLTSHKEYTLKPIVEMSAPETKADALGFAFALKESRKLSVNVSFHDAIYLEQYSRLLPTWTLTPNIDDDVIFGTWLTGGVVISTDSFRRIINLVGWIPTDDIAEVIKRAGFNVPEDIGVLSKRKPVSQVKDDEKVVIVDLAISERQLTKLESLTTRVFKLPGRPLLEEFFNEHVIDIIFNAEKYQAMGISFPSALILHGPPGCGKTFAVERLVEFIGWPSYSIDSNSIGSPYIHETSKKISEVFDKAIDSAPSVIVIDEMESFLADRRSGGSSGLYHVEEVAEFLRRIPEAIKSRVLIIAMTNLIDMIDPAILRRGRFDHIIEVGMPSRVEVATLIESLLTKIPKEEDLQVDRVIDALAGKALSESAFVMREAARIAAQAGKSKLDQKSIDTALSNLPKTDTKENRRTGFIWDK
jgi:Cdc6-like AAA superfamily ATPase